MKRFKIVIKVLHRKISLGFSLIEILITTSIMALILTAALVNYNRVARRQRFEQQAHTILSEVRLARDKAMSGEKPEICHGAYPNEYSLGGYVFELLDRDGDTHIDGYDIRAVCVDEEGIEGEVEVKTGLIDQQALVVRAGVSRVRFLPLGDGLRVEAADYSPFAGDLHGDYWDGAVELESTHDGDVDYFLVFKHSGGVYLIDYEIYDPNLNAWQNFKNTWQDIFQCYLYFVDNTPGYPGVNCNDPDSEHYLPCCPPYRCVQNGKNYFCM